MGLHRLALELGKTKGELLDQLSFSEYQGWVKYFNQINQKPKGTHENPIEVDWAKADLNAMFGGESDV